jgi:DNA-binding MarR family transcriptional regulator
MQVQRIIEKIQTVLIKREEQEKIELQQVMDEVYRNATSTAHKHETTLTELHIIDCINRNSPINVTSIASILGITKGGVSKISNRLLKRGWIYKTQLLDNRKEVYFRLAPEGKKVAAIHETFHQIAAQNIANLIQNYEPSELQVLERLLDYAISSYSAG